VGRQTEAAIIVLSTKRHRPFAHGHDNPRAPPKLRWLAAAKATPRAGPSTSQSPPGEDMSNLTFNRRQILKFLGASATLVRA
jgi:hypothetical protein